MATRFYFPASTASPVSPAFNGSWTGTASALRRKLASTKGSSTIAAGSAISWPSSTGQKHLDRQYISDELAEQIISGTVKMQLVTKEGSNSDNVRHISLSIRVCSGDGTIIRGTLLTLDNYVTANEFKTITNGENRKGADGDSLTPLTVYDGDRLVIEIGYTTGTVAGNTPIAYGFWGENGTDCPENETQDGPGYNGWIEFSADLLFGSSSSSSSRSSSSSSSSRSSSSSSSSSSKSSSSSSSSRSSSSSSSSSLCSSSSSSSSQSRTMLRYGIVST